MDFFHSHRRFYRLSGLLWDRAGRLFLSGYPRRQGAPQEALSCHHSLSGGAGGVLLPDVVQLRHDLLGEGLAARSAGSLLCLAGAAGGSVAQDIPAADLSLPQMGQGLSVFGGAVLLSPPDTGQLCARLVCRADSSRYLSECEPERRGGHRPQSGGPDTPRPSASALPGGCLGDRQQRRKVHPGRRQRHLRPPEGAGEAGADPV